MAFLFTERADEAAQQLKDMADSAKKELEELQKAREGLNAENSAAASMLSNSRVSQWI